MQLLRSHRIVLVEGNYLLLFGDEGAGDEGIGASAENDGTSFAAAAAAGGGGGGIVGNTGDCSGGYDPESLEGITAVTFAAPVWDQLGGCPACVSDMSGSRVEGGLYAIPLVRCLAPLPASDHPSYIPRQALSGTRSGIWSAAPWSNRCV